MDLQIVLTEIKQKFPEEIAFLEAYVTSPGRKLPRDRVRAFRIRKLIQDDNYPYC